ncbi:hypothetical protein ACFWHP_21870, partial [Streptomyces sp. NPDC127020]
SLRPTPPRAARAAAPALHVRATSPDRLSAVEYDGELLAVISRRWLTLRDTYGVDVVRDDADPALLIALTVCVIHLAEKEREKDDGEDD